MPQNANILVGCGGSGIKTLLRLNELLAEDNYWRSRIAHDMYYIVIDTELDCLAGFEATVRHQLRGASMPVIKPIRLAQGMDCLRPTVMQYFVTPFTEVEGAASPKRRGGKDKGKGQQRLYEHWWNQGASDPFVAPFVKPLTKGAGQCPAASYFLAWQSLRQIEKTFDDVLKAVLARKRTDNRKDPLEGANFCIIAGLAGGTGRGCWAVIGFKVRELFKSVKRFPPPVAMLFDVSTFDNVMKSRAELSLAMQVNALTGFSELAGWMRNIHGTTEGARPPRLAYRLPSMEDPGDEKMDVLRMEEGDDINSPVDNAFLVFDKSEKSVLGNNDQYHEMAGTALYAAISKSCIEDRSMNVRNIPYFGVAAATFEVNSTSLRKYFEGLARIRAIEILSHRDAAALDEALTAFLKANPLLLGVTDRDRRGFKADEKGNFLQQACQALLKSYDNEMTALSEALEADIPSEVKEMVGSIVAASPAKAEKAVKDAVAKLGNPLAHLADEIRTLYGETKSVENIRSFLDQLFDRLTLTLENLPSPARMKVEQHEEPAYLAEALAGREYKILGRHYNSQECEEIKNRTYAAILYANYETLQAEIKKAYQPWLAAVAVRRRSATVVLERTGKLLAKFRDELAETVGKQPGEDLFDVMFTDAQNPEKGIPDKYSVETFYRRDLKPVLKRGEERALLEGRVAFSDELNALVLASLIEKSLEGDAVEDLRKQLEEHLREGVHVEQEYNFIENNFAIRKVVEALRGAWLDRFLRVRNDRDKLNELTERFEAFFGVRPERDGDEFRLDEVDDLILAMSASLASTCKPFWMLRGGKEQPHHVMLFLPPSGGKLDVQSATDKIKSTLADNVAPEIITETKEGQANPFILLAYSYGTSHDLDNIVSLDYWDKDATVKRWLEWCEDDSGRSIFSHADNNKGVGYVDPLYVKNEVLSGLRWKPWLSDQVAPVAAKTHDAMLFALLEPGGPVKERLDAIGWSAPLIYDTGKETYKFRRCAYKLDEDVFVEDATCPWKKGQQVCQSIWQVFDVLSGKGNKAGRRKEEGPIWRDRILEEGRLFWDTVAVKIGCGLGSDAYRSLLRDYEQVLLKFKNKAKADDKAVWEQLIERLGTWREGRPARG